jgi:hypothetical protein
VITTVLSGGQLLAVLAAAVPLIAVVLVAAGVLIDRRPAVPRPLRRPQSCVYDGVPDWGWSVWDPYSGGILRAHSGLPPAAEGARR